MRHFSASEVHAALPYPRLIERLREAFREGGEVPLRQHYAIQPPSGSAAAGGMLLVMPAWQPGRFMGIKAVSVFAGNAAQGLPSVIGAYLLMDANTGAPVAVLDGVALTLRRTACASALAAGYLARPDAAHFLMVGAGALAPHLVRAHLAVRRYRVVSLWNRNPAKAEQLAAALADLPVRLRVVTDLPGAVAEADTISCATLSRAPLVPGAALKPGAHLDLVGGFTPEMRETDDAAVARAQIYVDTRAGALKEAGDLVQPLARGVLSADDLRGDLFDLCRADLPPPRDPGAITLFKSVGYALEDLAAAEAVYEQELP